MTGYRQYYKNQIPPVFNIGIGGIHRAYERVAELTGLAVEPELGDEIKALLLKANKLLTDAYEQWRETNGGLGPNPQQILETPES